MEPVIKKIAETPAEMLSETVKKTQKVVQEFNKNRQVKEVKDYWNMLGPGLTTGAADDDPSGVATYSQAGARYGFQLLWLSAITFPLMAVVQEMCARIGMVTGRGLAGNIRKHFPRWALYTCTILLFAANTLNIGADIGAMAKAAQLLFPQFYFPLFLVFFTGVSLFLQIFTSYKEYAKYLKLLALVLFSYVLSGLLVKMDWSEVLYHTVVSSLTFSKEQIILITGILGTTISPYLFFWQTSQEVEEKRAEGKTTLKELSVATNKDISRMRIDVWSGMFISNVVMFFIIATCAVTLHAAGITTVSTAAEAAEALKPLAGPYAYLLFTIGIIGAGMLAIPILAGSASYALSESLRWRFGLNQKLKQASAFYGAIIIAMLVGLGMNFVGIDPIKALLYSAVFNGIVAPVVLIFIVLLSSNKEIMGKRVNSLSTMLVGWGITGLMAICSVATIGLLLSQ